MLHVCVCVCMCMWHVLAECVVCLCMCIQIKHNKQIKSITSSKHGLYTIHTYMHVYIMCALCVCVISFCIEHYCKMRKKSLGTLKNKHKVQEEKHCKGLCKKKTCLGQGATDMITSAIIPALQPITIMDGSWNPTIIQRNSSVVPNHGWIPTWTMTKLNFFCL